MALLGALDIKDSERPFTSVAGRRLIWDATQELFQQWNDDVRDAENLFVQETTTLHQERYELPGGGEAEALPFEESKPGEVKRSGSWDTAYPLYVMGNALGYNRVSLAYLTMGTYRATLQTIMNQGNNTTFRRLLSALLKNTTTTFTDPVYGSLTVQPLANNDSVNYPPKIGATANSTENFYLSASYDKSAISNANNPFLTIVNALEPRFGYGQGGSPIVVLMNPDAEQYVQYLPDFVGVTLHNVQPGDDVPVPNGFPPDRFIPWSARFFGTANGCWVVSWPRMPTNTLIGIHLAAPPPLKMRIDDVPGLGDGTFQMICNNLTGDEMFHEARWIRRCGYGVGNRLAAVAMVLGQGSYTIPTGYTTLQ